MDEVSEKPFKPEYFSHVVKCRPVIQSLPITNNKQFKERELESETTFACINCELDHKCDLGCRICHGKGCLSLSDPLVQLIEAVVDYKLGSEFNKVKLTESILQCPNSNEKRN
jgi:hypothetical protein